MSKQNIIEINQISKNYERKIALSSLSFAVKKGELIALIGPSGAGKTTLLNLLASILQPDQGELIVDGKPADKGLRRSQKTSAKKIGIIRQQFDLIGQLAVVHNVLAGRLADWGFFKSLFSLFIPQEKNSAQAACKEELDLTTNCMNVPLTYRVENSNESHLLAGFECRNLKLFLPMSPSPPLTQQELRISYKC